MNLYTYTTLITQVLPIISALLMLFGAYLAHQQGEYIIKGVMRGFLASMVVFALLLSPILLAWAVQHPLNALELTATIFLWAILLNNIVSEW